MKSARAHNLMMHMLMQQSGKNGFDVYEGSETEFGLKAFINVRFIFLFTLLNSFSILVTKNIFLSKSFQAIKLFNHITQSFLGRFRIILPSTINSGPSFLALCFFCSGSHSCFSCSVFFRFCFLDR